MLDVFEKNSIVDYDHREDKYLINDKIRRVNYWDFVKLVDNRVTIRELTIEELDEDLQKKLPTEIFFFVQRLSFTLRGNRDESLNIFKLFDIRL